MFFVVYYHEEYFILEELQPNGFDDNGNLVHYCYGQGTNPQPLTKPGEQGFFYWKQTEGGRLAFEESQLGENPINLELP